MESLRSLPVSIEHPASALVLRGRRVTLRPLELTDAEPIAREVEASLFELRRTMLWAHYPQTALLQLARIKTSIADYHAGRRLEMALVAEDGGLLCLSGLERRVPLNPNGWEVGYWTPTRRARQGWATLTTQLLVLYAFDLLGADRVQILVDEGNAASLRVVEKVGFVREAVLTNVTSVASAEQVAQGYGSGSRTVLSALWPASYARLAWPTELRRDVEVKNLVGHRVTGFWS